MGNIYIGDSSSKAKKVKSAYIGIDGKAKKIKKAYIGDANGKARLVWSSQSSMYGSIALVYGRYLYFTKDYFATSTSYYNEASDMIAVKFVNDRYIMTGSYGRISSFKDGVFTLLYAPSNLNTTIWGIAFNDKNIVCYGYNKVILSKDGGATWTEKDMGISDTNFAYGNHNCMIHDGTQFVCIKPSGKVYISQTGETWTQKSFPGEDYKYIFYLNGKYFVGRDGIGKFKYSTDLVNWQECSNSLGSMWWPSGSSNTVYSVPQMDYINGIYTLAQARTYSLPTGYSRDGITWEYVGDYYPMGGFDYYSLNCGDRILLFSYYQSDGKPNRIWQTTNGINYSEVRENNDYYMYTYNTAYADK